MNTNPSSKYITITATEAASMTKMAIALHVMGNIQADPSMPANRETFHFKQVMMDHGLSAAACYTYARNARLALSGGDPYETNKKWYHAQAEKRVENPLASADRWCVEDKASKKLLESFTSRSAAQSYNKAMKSEGVDARWFDKTKIA